MGSLRPHLPIFFLWREGELNMIEKFKENEARKSALIYLSNFEQVKELYEDDKEMAGELAISILEMALTGEISSDNKMIRLMLKNFEVSAEKNKQKYEARERNTKQEKAEKYNLYEIAEMLNEGKTQTEIADALGISRQTVNRRLNEMIRVDYPELLCSNEKMSKMSKMSNDVKQCKNNENENENENENVNDNVNDNVKVSAEGQKKLAELDKYINDKIERIMEEKGYKLVKDFDVSVDRIQLDKEYSSRRKQILERYKII